MIVKEINQSLWRRQMKKKIASRLPVIFAIVMIVSLVSMSVASASSTTKSLSTNFTLVNMGTTAANVDISYYKPDGTPWTGSGYTSFSIDPDGGQAIVRQYQDTLTPGSGSVVISSDQPLGSMIQIQNKSGVGLPTSGAYLGFSSGAASVGLPLLSRQAPTASGLSNTQVVVQNAGASSTSVTISFYTLGSSSGTPVFTTPSTSIQPGASWTYDLADELATNIPDNWWGSGVVNSNGSIVAVVNWYLGPDGLNSYEGVPTTTVASKWFVPLLYIRLPNTLSTSLSIQNVSGGDIPAGDITLFCRKDATSGGSATLSYSNTTSFTNKNIYTFNTGTASIFPEANWYGSCTVTSATAKNIVVLIQDRYIGGGNTGAYIGIPATSTDKTLYVPLVAKRLANNFATTATIINLNESADAHVTLTYTPSGGGTQIVRTGVVIPAGSSIIRNFRMSTTESPEMTDGWVGTLKVTSSDQPIQAFLQNTFLTVEGDQLMEYVGFTKP
jgi:hypothetical protein